jgi:hypothetical protein
MTSTSAGRRPRSTAAPWSVVRVDGSGRRHDEDRCTSARSTDRLAQRVERASLSGHETTRRPLVISCHPERARPDQDRVGQRSQQGHHLSVDRRVQADRARVRPGAATERDDAIDGSPILVTDPAV